MAPWADVLFAIDANWWKMHLPEVRRDFLGHTYSSNDFNGRVGRVPSPFKAFGNSGAGCIALAGKAGAARVILLGYDCKRTGGKVHWHGDHPKGLGNAGSMHEWPRQFTALQASFRRLQIINCSRATALTMFPRMPLEAALAGATP